MIDDSASSACLPVAEHGIMIAFSNLITVLCGENSLERFGCVYYCIQCLTTVHKIKTVHSQSWRERLH
jgi:hypothetical protein